MNGGRQLGKKVGEGRQRATWNEVIQGELRELIQRDVSPARVKWKFANPC